VTCIELDVVDQVFGWVRREEVRKNMIDLYNQYVATRNVPISPKRYTLLLYLYELSICFDWLVSREHVSQGEMLEMLVADLIARVVSDSSPIHRITILIGNHISFHTNRTNKHNSKKIQDTLQPLREDRYGKSMVGQDFD